MGGQFPAGAGAQHVHAQLRVVGHGILGASGRIALPGDDEHIAHADVVHHVAARTGKAVPALVFHIRLDAVQPAGGHAGEGDGPAAVLSGLAQSPGHHRFARALQRHAGLYGGGAAGHFFKLQRQFLREMDAVIGTLQADGRGAVRPLLEDLPGGGAPGDDDAEFHKKPSFL